MNKEKKVPSKKKSGFTLIEMMIVVVIIALLSAVAIPFMMDSQERAVASVKLNNAAALKSACKAYVMSQDDMATAMAEDLSTANWTIYLEGGDPSTLAVKGVDAVIPVGFTSSFIMRDLTIPALAAAMYP